MKALSQYRQPQNLTAGALKAYPSSGSRVFSIKVPVSLIRHVDATVKRFVLTRRQAPITRNEFIRRAIEEKLDHLRRSSRPRRQRPRATATLSAGENSIQSGMVATGHGRREAPS